MVSYDLPDDVRAGLAPHHRRLQYLIAKLASERLGLSLASHGPIGIGKYQGGVQIGAVQICIRRDGVQDDWNQRSLVPVPEERAVVEAIEMLGREFEAEGEAMFARHGVATLSRDQELRLHDPLRSMFE